MSYALFVGCRIPASLPDVEHASRAVLRALGVRVTDLDFTCCGYPSRHLRLDAWLLLAGRNLGLAARAGLGLLTLCQCCYGSLRHAQHLLRTDAALRAAVHRELAAEGLPPVEHVPVVHLLTVLDRDVGADALRARVVAPQTGRRVAAHYGCHALRPSDVVDLDNSQAPTIFERLIAATGAEPVDWPRRLDCCGAPLADAKPVLARRLRATKLADAREAGAEEVCTACPYCQEQLAPRDEPGGLPVEPYPRLLARALGLPAG